MIQYITNSLRSETMFRKGCHLVCFLLLFITLINCNSGDEVVSTTDVTDSLIVANLASIGNDSATRAENGIYSYPTFLNPSGANAANAVLSVYYTMSTLGGSVIASHQPSDGDPMVLRQGASAVYPVGLDIALAVMNEGDSYGFILPSNLAYDTLTFGIVPVNSIIEFQVDLIEVQSIEEVNVAEDSAMMDYISEALLDSLELVPLDSVEFVGPGNSIAFKRLEAGGVNMPRAGNLVSIIYEGRFLEDSVVFDGTGPNTPFEYTFNGGVVIPGLDVGVSQMALGERALIIIPSRQAYRESAAIFPNSITAEAIANQVIPDFVADVGPYRTLIFDVTLQAIN